MISWILQEQTRPNDEWKGNINTSFVILTHWIFYRLQKHQISPKYLCLPSGFYT